MKSCENHKITLKHMTFPRNDFSQREITSCWRGQPAPYFSSLSKISNPSHGTIPSKQHGRSLSRSMAMVIYNREWPRINEQNLVWWHAIDFVSIFWWLGGHLSEMKCVLWAGSKSCWSRAGPIASYISFWLIRWLKSPSDFPSLIPFPYYTPPIIHALTGGGLLTRLKNDGSVWRKVGFTNAFTMFNEIFTLHIPGLSMESSTNIWWYSHSEVSGSQTLF